MIRLPYQLLSIDLLLQLSLLTKCANTTNAVNVVLLTLLFSCLSNGVYEYVIILVNL